MLKKKIRKRYLLPVCMALLFSLLCTGCKDKQESDSLQELKLEQEEEKLSEDSNENNTKDSTQEHSSTFFVYVCGAVHAPGVYELDNKARVYEALKKAGGITDEAADDSLNQARPVVDGERIYVPTKEELEQGNIEGIQSEAMNPAESAADDTQNKVDLNTASKEELKTLPGIGDAKASSIISYREEHGAFQTVEELMQVEGIKEGVFEKIKDSIIVNAGS